MRPAAQMENIAMRITNLRVNHLKNPCGYRMDQLTFSWITENKEGKEQKKARLCISEDRTFKKLCYDSGKKKDISSVGFSPEFPLQPERLYYWKVEVWDEHGRRGVSKPAFFRTGKMERGWRADWITSGLGEQVQPLFRKIFDIPRKIRRAWVSISCLGLFELYINGRKAGEEYLTPYCTHYTNWLQYLTWDVTALLKKGTNAIWIMTGNGWYKGRFGYIDGLDRLYGDTLGIICELSVELSDGSTLCVLSDESWRCCPSAVIESSIYDGEIYDCRKEYSGFSLSDAEGPNWKNVEKMQPPEGMLTERLSTPVSVQGQRKPVRLIHTPAGEQVLDFGQNMTGWVQCRVKLAEGQILRLQYGEILQNGNFYNRNLRTAKAQYCCIGDGRDRVVRPHFTFYGFRYVRVEGIEKVNPEDFTAQLLHSDMERTGRIVTSNEKINQLFENIWWSQRDNFLDVPTDCPQRDERMGWTGDAQVFCESASFNADTSAFYRKYLFDLLLEQKKRGGSVPHVIPDILRQISLRTGEGEEDPSGSSVWGDAAAVIPWTLYRFYGDKALLKAQYESMKLWADYMYSCDRNNGGTWLWESGFHFGDWLSLDQPNPETPFGATDPFYIASVFYYYSTVLTAKAAHVLGYRADAAALEERAGKIRQAVRKKYFTAEGELRLDTQTAMVLALHMDLVPAGSRRRLAGRLSRKIAANGGHLDTGFAGTPYLCLALSENGKNEDSYHLLLNEEYPGWLYAVNLGATTIWERWNSVLPDGSISKTEMNSLNHYAYGSVAEWMYRVMCGLNPEEKAPGFVRARISPLPDDMMEWVKLEYRSAAGTYRISWKNRKNTIQYRITVPFSAQAVFILPQGQQFKTIRSKDGEPAGTGRKLYLKSGTYQITAYKH